MSFKLQKIKNANVKLQKGPNGRYDEVKTYWILINGKNLHERVEIWPAKLSDHKYVCSLWAQNECKTLTANTLEDIKRQIAENAFIHICHDNSFGVKCLPAKLLQAKLSAKYQDKPLYELLSGEIEGDFTDKIYLSDL